jgi:hypothetical protein
MRKYNFSDELMARFYDGETTAAETMMILNAAKEDPELKKEIDFMTSFPEDLMDVRVSREEISSAKIISLQPSFVPMWRLAAQSKSYDKNSSISNDCVVRCEFEILKTYQPDVTIESLLQLSKDNKWLQPEGTPLYNIGRLLEHHKLSVVRRYDCKPEVISQELQGNCRVIVVVNAEKLYGSDNEKKDPNHAVIIKQIDQEFITVYDPQHQKEDNYSLSQFIEAWESSHYYLVSVTERGLRRYDPQPIDVKDFQLTSDLEELMEAIAENCHDVWARQRMDEGWTYGPNRDDDKKHSPDLVPYSDLPEKEKEYDRLMARETLKLVRGLGYKIVKEG